MRCLRKKQSNNKALAREENTASRRVTEINKGLQLQLLNVFPVSSPLCRPGDYESFMVAGRWCRRSPSQSQTALPDSPVLQRQTESGRKRGLVLRASRASQPPLCSVAAAAAAAAGDHYKWPLLAWLGCRGERNKIIGRMWACAGVPAPAPSLCRPPSRAPPPLPPPLHSEGTES